MHQTKTHATRTLPATAKTEPAKKRAPLLSRRAKLSVLLTVLALSGIWAVIGAGALFPSQTGLGVEILEFLAAWIIYTIALVAFAGCVLFVGGAIAIFAFEIVADFWDEIFNDGKTKREIVDHRYRQAMRRRGHWRGGLSGD